MASSSSSSSSSADFPSSFYCSCSSMSAQVKPRTYGVFLNFRGKDTREGFVSFLHRDMERRGIRAYLDSVELEKGAHIDTIIDAIQDSNIAVVVFSKEYATSSFCLAELVEIMECRKTTGLLVLVVFYRVTPENVENVEDEKDLENPNKSFAKEFVTHKESNDEATISKWKTALKKAAPIAGWDYASKDISDESALVTKIVEDVLGKLRRVYSTNDFNGLVGMHSRVKKLESLLRIGEEENDTHTRTVGICGMGGIEMHDLSQDVGREIVQQQGEPGRRSRLWRSKEICDVLANNKGTPAVEGIFLDVSMIDSVCLGQTLFSNMTEIKLLKFYHPKIATFVADYRGRFTRRYDPYICYVTYQHNLSCPRGLDSLPHQLRYLVWHLYPLKYLPPKFCFEKLVELDMSYSNVKRLWTGNQDLPNLRVVKMGHCKHLIEMPNFSRAPKVEIIDFQYCEQLPRISPSIACLKNLMELNLSCCSKIENVPSTKNLPSLEKLLLSNCKRLDKLSEFSEKIEELNLDGTAITEIHSSSQLRSLRKIDLSDCCNLRNFPELSQSLEELYLSQTPAAILECPSIRDFLGGGFSSLRHLDLSKCLVAEIPLSIKQLWHLESLEVSRSPSLAILPELPPHVILLKARFCESLVIVPNSSFALTESYQKSLNFTVVFEFDGCYKLSQEAQTNISNHALCIIQTLSRLPQNVDRKYEIKFIYAGNKIPDWINCGNPGSSITVDLPPDWHDTSKFFGFVLCVVFSDTTVSPEPLVCECHFKSKNGTRDAKFHVTLMHSWCKLKQNVFLWYSSHLNLHQAIIGNVKEEEDYSEASFHFHLLWRTSNKRLESCGVRLLYNH